MTWDSRIKNDLVSWFVKNMVAPNLMRLDTPGFVTVKKNFAGTDIEQRNLFYSEIFMADFESSLAKELGKEGKKIAYSIGKEYGFAYAHAYAIPRLGIESDKEIDDFITFYRAFMGVTWGEFLDIKYDLKTRIFEADLGDHIVCRKNGLGYIFTEGSLAGGLQHVMQDDTIQGVQVTCIGRGDKTCRLITGPEKYLKQKNYPFIHVVATTTFPVDRTYIEMNKVRPLEHSKASLKELISAGFLKLQDNKLTFHDDRYSFTGLEVLYVSERFARNDPRVAKILFKAAFKQGKGIADLEKNNDYSTFIPDILSALGFGDTMISQIGGSFATQTNYFPYFSTYAEIDYHYFKGLLSGLLSGFTGKKVLLKSHTVDVSNGHLQLNLS